ncbi:AUGMIN subunit 8-like [Andrographis paniculata]|uniref:AUGMIN subunit 8-like n=1 Tax=Andrographis paniculata TaxID=175694 RepID=UPI0021E78954|nr:AUGMIN subunit 8-like [Andrographis paniculata]XP_051133320.1 AUGMIN subunit 8-like [Andrographis paniculata]XP_051133321.1 AUGMIN subunit 8-like [Andrographis paniculata]XP_051133322.1 AUGMIN subunit 8-like [Andrographis paniculata]XP_051133323.1 AUGMIN subunit 8-like [Andrographis paniculata]XP_051133324.1 AUGMIN subunit 8-like [Andrographis paniculata]
MDVCEPEQAQASQQKQQSSVRTRRRPLVPADNKNGANSPRSGKPEIISRCRSPIPSAAMAPKRCPSPNPSRLSSTSSLSAPKRAMSIERKRPSRPSSPLSPSTPIEDTAAEVLLGSRKMVVGNGLPECLWPSTMRSLSVSFQSDSYCVPITKKEKPVSHVSSDRTAKLPSNGAHRQAGITALRKSTPEGKKSPLKGKHSSGQLENFKPVDSFRTRVVDQHRWSSRTSEEVSTSLNRSIQMADRIRNSSSITSSEMGAPSLRKLSVIGTSKSLQKSTSDLLMKISRDENGKAVLGGSSIDDGSPRMLKRGFSSSSDRTRLANAAARAMSLATSGSRSGSPLMARGVNSSGAKAVNYSSRGISPGPVRPSSPSRQPQNSTSVLSFIADIKKGKKVAYHIEDVHQLRLVYNRHLQWRYANARTDAVVQYRKVKAEKVLYSTLRVISGTWDVIMEKRIDIQQLKLKLNLYSILNNQLTYLDKWASVEVDHLNSLTTTIQYLQSSTTLIPLTYRASGDIEAVKAALCSAVDAMQAVGSSLCSIILRVEGTNSLASELADVAVKERAMVRRCESILSSTAALQVEDYSRRAHLLQMNRASRK